jgi:hypothetical protein
MIAVSTTPAMYCTLPPYFVGAHFLTSRHLVMLGILSRLNAHCNLSYYGNMDLRSTTVCIKSQQWELRTAVGLGKYYVSVSTW